MTTGFDLHVFVIFSTDLTKLKSGAHFTVQLILLLLRQSKLRLVTERGTYQITPENKNTKILTKTHTYTCVRFYDFCKDFPSLTQSYSMTFKLS